MKARWGAITKFYSTLSSSSSISTFIKKKFQLSVNPIQEAQNSDFTLDHVDMSTLLSICGKEGYIRLGSSLHASIIKNYEYFDPISQPNFRNVIAVWNSLVSLYSKCGDLFDAAKVFGEMPIRDSVSWNSMISGFLKIGEFRKGFDIFKQMQSLDFCTFDQTTLTTILSACNYPGMIYVCMMMHTLVLRNGYEKETSVGNALITNYFKCGCSESGRRVFYEMFECNVITWTAVISGFAQSEFRNESLHLFLKMRRELVEPNSLTYTSSLQACSGLRKLTEGRQIHGLVLKSGYQSDFRIESALMDMYSKCNCMEDACCIFDSAEEIDEISMTVILVGFAQNGMEEEAIRVFMKMLKTGINIDANIVSAILGADLHLTLGKQIHSLVVKKSFGSNPYVSNGLINTYSKCGELVESVKVFSSMVERNAVSWNSMIAAFARHGRGFESLQLYEQMRSESEEPTDVTFLSLLQACSHIGSIEKGMELLKSMSNVHGIIPRVEHYACVVDMLGRAGNLKEAKSFIEGLPVKPGVAVWQALLGACSIHGNSDIGRYAANNLLLSEPESKTAHVLMANIYTSDGRWEDRAKVIKKMKGLGVKKETGMSWIDIHKDVHSFVVEDRVHPQAEEIYEVMEDLHKLMKDEGYVPK
ncbi:Pentatricopeptide repeat-containing protein [Thalictrum thalictroides]|uniref:Pentatricopeptide repeat-containing protein n=1 Tax=Thalictrum thalictroides TaxID=46969 RepID=A0A7J6WF99_THATH|nr:Pentatricopeptide repeat-containing protein [Thalictrum thalictroides]